MTAFIGQAKRLLANCCNRDLPRRSIRYLFASVATTVLTASAFAQASPDWKNVEAAAKKEGTVSLYHNLRPSGIEKLLSEFRKTYPGIKTEHMRLGSAPPH